MALDNAEKQDLADHLSRLLGEGISGASHNGKQTTYRGQRSLRAELDILLNDLGGSPRPSTAQSVRYDGWGSD